MEKELLQNARMISKITHEYLEFSKSLEYAHQAFLQNMELCRIAHAHYDEDCAEQLELLLKQTMEQRETLLRLAAASREYADAMDKCVIPVLTPIQW